jgi:hypothetical protein
VFRLDRLEQRKVKQRIVILVEVIRWVRVLDGLAAPRQQAENEEKDAGDSQAMGMEKDGGMGIPPYGKRGARDLGGVGSGRGRAQ